MSVWIIGENEIPIRVEVIGNIPYTPGRYIAYKHEEQGMGTTNEVFSSKKEALDYLKESKLDFINISLDTIKDERNWIKELRREIKSIDKQLEELDDKIR